MSIVSFQRVSKDYITDGAAVPALREVSLEVERGAFVALIGRRTGLATVLATATPNPQAAAKFHQAAQTTAVPGRKTRVPTTVAMELAAS